MQTAQKNKFLNDISIELEELRSKKRKDLSAIIKKMKKDIRPKHDWETFSYQFQEVHPEFSTSLIRQFPDLSPTELKICCLLKISLSTKDIANLLNIEARTVKIQRGNIRKKFSLPVSANLESFIGNI